MADKRYYWIKVSSDWFQSPEVKVLRKLPGGDTYALIYLEMMVLSAPDGGYIYFEHIASDFAEELAIRLDEKKEAVSILLSWLEAKKLVSEGKSTDIIHFDRIDEMTGSETDAARRMRLKRMRHPKLVNNNTNLKLNNTNNLPRNNVQKCSTSRVRDRDRVRDKDKLKKLQNNFEQLWNLFPVTRRVGKEDGLKAYIKAVNEGIKETEISQGTKNYLKFVKIQNYSETYIKLASNFFIYRTWKQYISLPEAAFKKQGDKVKEHLPDWAQGDSQTKLTESPINPEAQKELDQRLAQIRNFNKDEVN